VHRKTDGICFLEKLKKEGKLSLEKGNEVKVVTKKGVAFEGILFDFKEDYLQTVTALGILILFPLSSLTNIYQL
jgi:hypothetical protein